MSYISAVREREILIGMVLGDACLEKDGFNCHLKLDHGNSQQALLEWKCRELSNFNRQGSQKLVRFDERTKKNYIHFLFQTVTHPLFTDYWKIFYKNKRKIIPENINKILVSPLSLAVWYMDDGYKRNDC